MDDQMILMTVSDGEKIIIPATNKMVIKKALAEIYGDAERIEEFEYETIGKYITCSFKDWVDGGIIKNVEIEYVKSLNH